MSQLSHGQKPSAPKAFLPFWESFDLGIDDGRFDQVFSVDDDMPTRFALARQHAQDALRRYAESGFTRHDIETDPHIFQDDPDYFRVDIKKIPFKRMVEFNLGLALSLPCEDLPSLASYADSITKRGHYINSVFTSIRKHAAIDFGAISSCLSTKEWAQYSQVTGLQDIFKEVCLADSVDFAQKAFGEFVDITSRIEQELAKIPYESTSKIRRWNNPHGEISPNEFYLRFDAQMSLFRDRGMSDDNGLCEWLEAMDLGVENLPGYAKHMEALASDISKKLYDALTDIDEALPAFMHRLHDAMLHEVSKHVDVRDNYLGFIGKNPGWILSAKQRPDYDLYFLETMLRKPNINAAMLKAARSTLREYGLSKTEKLLRHNSSLLLEAYRITGHDPMIASMNENEQAQALALNLGV